MSTYALDANGNRWWWIAAAAGTATAGAITAVLVIPATTTEAPSAPLPATAFVVPPADRDWPCFSARVPRPGWDRDLPVCRPGPSAARPRPLPLPGDDPRLQALP